MRLSRKRGPRACGDVPHAYLNEATCDVWSPRMRGCSPSGQIPHQRDAVVPAHAGMFPTSLTSIGDCSGGPRACGDVPSKDGGRPGLVVWSPRMRGCSRHRAGHGGLRTVVPAHAGMFPAPADARSPSTCGPRACGDVPLRSGCTGAEEWWSPRMRGCSRIRQPDQMGVAVVPAHAGMFPSVSICKRSCTRGPRACGDVPVPRLAVGAHRLWSPRMRGCSLKRLHEGQLFKVVPAHAGMFPAARDTPIFLASGPRACGDVPKLDLITFYYVKWSPRMRGCSQRIGRSRCKDLVVPAHAGMFPKQGCSWIETWRGPRACGDVPGEDGEPHERVLWSPRMRGCSRCKRRRCREIPVVPAHAGMFPFIID